jgi:hypothetical protein
MIYDRRCLPGTKGAIASAASKYKTSSRINAALVQSSDLGRRGPEVPVLVHDPSPRAVPLQITHKSVASEGSIPQDLLRRRDSPLSFLLSPEQKPPEFWRSNVMTFFKVSDLRTRNRRRLAVLLSSDLCTPRVTAINDADRRPTRGREETIPKSPFWEGASKRGYRSWIAQRPTQS